ncbi:hypothetical protein LguiB_014083 [Lonicera macranthoides]
MKMLRSLSDKFEPKKYAIEESNDLSTMTPEILSSKLRIFEMELDMKKSLRNKGKNTISNDSNFAFSTSTDFDLESCVLENGDIDLETIDMQLALLSKQFKRIVKFRNTYAVKQGKNQFQNNKFPHNYFQGNGVSKNNKQNFNGQNQITTSSGRDLSHIQCRKCKKYGHYANNCPTRVNNQSKAHISQTWDDDIDDTMDTNVCLDDGSDDDTNVNYIAFCASVNSDSEGSNSSVSDSNESSGMDDLNYKKMYTSATKKCLKLGSLVDKLNAKIEMLTSQIKTSAEESLIFSQSFEQEKKDSENRIQCLEKQNFALEQKYKATLVELEKSKEGFVDVSKKLKGFEKGKEQLDNILKSGQKNNDKKGIGFVKSSFQKNQPSSSNFIRFSDSKNNSKPFHAQMKTNNNFRAKRHWEIPKYKQYCSICDRYGHTRYDCAFYDDWYEPVYDVNLKYGFPYMSSFGYDQRNSFSHAGYKRKNKSKRQTRPFSNANGYKNFQNKKIKAIWVRKDDLNSQLRCNVVLTAYKANENSSQWYLDSGCSRHMSGDRNIFTSLKNYQGGSVTFGDGKVAKIVGRGTVESPGLPKLDNVLLVEGLKANLLSISQFCDTNHTVLFSKENCKILNGEGQCILTGNRTMDNCYAVIHDISFQKCNLTQLDNIDLWHQRLGHINFKDLNTLTSKELVKGVPKLGRVKNVVCEPCQVGKQTKTQHKKIKDILTSHPLELLHMDLMGPSRTISLCGNSYMLVIVDDFSRFTWIAFLKEKSETFLNFHKIALKLQNEKDTAITKIRSDRGGEFKDTGIIEFCAGNGISHEFSAPKTPQQNGVVERKNRTIQNMARVMLHSKHLSKQFWVEAVRTACHVINRVYVRPKTETTAYEIWFGKRPNLKYLRVFGSLCFVCRDREQLDKFDTRGDKAIFLGYSSNSRAYRVFNIRTKTIMESANVVVNDTTINENVELVDFGGVPILEIQTDFDKEELVSNENILNESSSKSPKSTNLQNQISAPNYIRNRHPEKNVIGGIADPIMTRSQAKKNYALYSCFVSLIEPKNVSEALEDENWINAMHEELHQFIRHDVWYLVPRPTHTNVIGTKWVFKNKCDEEGNIIRNKARLVAQGYNQIDGIDVRETFAPVARIESVRLLLCMACYLHFKLYQMDVKSAFLNGLLSEEVYVEQPKGFIDHKKPDYVYRLKKALYGLKQAPRAWYDRLAAYLISKGYVRGSSDKTLFIKFDDDIIIVAQVYVDDIVFGSTSELHAQNFAKIMQTEFEMSMMGELNYFLGLQVKQFNSGIFISQTKYARDLVKRFGLENAKHVSTPLSVSTKLAKDVAGKKVDATLYRSMIGSLLYLTSSRPDILFSVCACARYQSEPKESHLSAVKRIVRYVNGTLSLGIWYTFDTSSSIVGYCDADWAGCTDDRKSTSGSCFYIGNNLVAWSSKKQNCISLSTAEAEYISAGSCSSQLLWLKQMLADYKVEQGSMILFCDNMSAINISKNPVQHSRTKHIDIRHHFIRDLVDSKIIQIEYVDTKNQLADLFTKPLDKERFQELRKALGICSID